MRYAKPSYWWWFCPLDLDIQSSVDEALLTRLELKEKVKASIELGSLLHDRDENTNKLSLEEAIKHILSKGFEESLWDLPSVKMPKLASSRNQHRELVEIEENWKEEEAKLRIRLL